MSDEKILKSTRSDARGKPVGVHLEDAEAVKDWVDNILANTADRILEDDVLPPHIAPGSMAANVWRFARLVEITSALAKCWMQASRMASVEYHKTQDHAKRGDPAGEQDADEGGPGQ